MNKRIAFMPVSFFGIIMGLAGLNIALEKLEHLMFKGLTISFALFLIILVLFLAFLGAYMIKVLFYLDNVIKEFKNPVTMGFFPMISISFILLAIIGYSFSKLFSFVFWGIGTVLHLIFTLLILSEWIYNKEIQISHIHPGWFIPPVGNILVPVVGVYFSPVISWFFYSIGIMFWIILMVIVFYRIIFHSPLSERLTPTLFILIAPPAVGFISLVKLALLKAGKSFVFSEFQNILYFFGLFITILLLVNANKFRRLKFYISWWAYSFPVAAITIATFLYFHLTKKLIFLYIFDFLFIFLVLDIGVLLIKTILAIKNHEICVEH